MRIIKKLICLIFGHKWIYVDEHDSAAGEPLTRAICDRCDFDGGLYHLGFLGGGPDADSDTSTKGHEVW